MFRLSATLSALTALTLITVLAAACDKDAKSKPGEPGAAPAGKPAPAAAPGAERGGGSGPFAGWDLEARKAAFQGAHHTPGDAIGSWQAWDVKGDKVTIYDGTAEKTLELAITSPCTAKTTERDGDSSSSTTSHYTLKDGAIVMGLGNAGSRRGPEAIACVSNRIFTVDAAGACAEWEQDMFDDTRWESKPGTCGFARAGDKEIFKATVDGFESELLVEGDALLSEQLARVHSEKVADFAAAKAARDAHK